MSLEVKHQIIPGNVKKSLIGHLADIAIFGFRIIRWKRPVGPQGLHDVQKPGGRRSKGAKARGVSSAKQLAGLRTCTRYKGQESRKNVAGKDVGIHGGDDCYVCQLTPNLQSTC